MADAARISETLGLTLKLPDLSKAGYTLSEVAVVPGDRGKAVKIVSYLTPFLPANEQYRFRGLTAPRVWGPALVFGDAQGLVHLLSREQGQTLQRVTTDGTPVALQPVVAGRTLVIVNRSGLVSGWRVD